LVLGRGGRRVGAGRPKGVKTRWPPEIAAELRRLADGLQRLQQVARLNILLEDIIPSCAARQ